MMKDKVRLISAIVCFVAAVIELAGTAIGISDTLIRIVGIVNIVSLVKINAATILRR